jgi:hypothetical protein
VSPAELVPGEKYLLNVAPWGPHPVRYLGPSKWLPKSYSRVQNPITRRIFSIRTDRLMPLLVQVVRS